MGTAPLVSLPVTAVSYPFIADDLDVVGTGFLNDAGVATYLASVAMATTTQVRIDTFAASGTYVSVTAVTSSVPHAWNTGDKVAISFTYEAA